MNEVLTVICEASARMARNMPVLANLRQTEKGDFQMSKINDMALTIKELRGAATVINEVTGWLEEQFSNTESKEATKGKNPALTFEQVWTVLTDKSRYGHTAKIQALLQNCEAPKLSGVDPKNYENLLKNVEELK